MERAVGEASGICCIPGDVTDRTGLSEGGLLPQQPR